MAQPYTVIGPHPRPIRPAMRERVAHPFNPQGVNRLGRFSMKNPGNPAHGARLEHGGQRGNRSQHNN